MPTGVKCLIVGYLFMVFMYLANVIIYLDHKDQERRSKEYYDIHVRKW